MINIIDCFKDFENIKFSLVDNKCVLKISYKNNSVKAICDYFHTKDFEEIKNKTVDDIKFDSGMYNIIVECDSFGCPTIYRFRISEFASFSKE